MLLYVSIFEVGPEYGIDPIWGHQCSAPHDKFQIVEVPLDAPEDAEVIADVPLGLAGEGHHAACHDIGVLMNRDKQFAVCAAGQGVLFDISDPAAPVRLRDFGVEGIEPWHSAALSWDGSVAVLGWEPGIGVMPRCLATGEPLALFDEPGDQTDELKSIFFFDTERGDLLGKWTLPRAQTTLENCTIHNFTIVPTGSTTFSRSAPIKPEPGSSTSRTRQGRARSPGRIHRRSRAARPRSYRSASVGPGAATGTTTSSTRRTSRRGSTSSD